METPPTSALSPSLRVDLGDGVAAFELKHLLAEPLADAVESWARRHLRIDPHGDPAHHDRYRTTTLYLDTPALDVYHRAPGFARRKYRLRRYGREPTLFLERKIRRGDRVKKRRAAITAVGDGAFDFDDLVAAIDAADGNDEGPRSWFPLEVVERQLLPTCRLTYERTAFFEGEGDGALRLTLDRAIHGVRSDRDGWGVPPVDGGELLLADAVVCELKFAGSLPERFKELITELALPVSSVSKYRRFMELALGGGGRGGAAGGRATARDGLPDA